MGSLLVTSGHHCKVPRPGWLKQQAGIVSRPWSLEVQDAGSAGPVPSKGCAGEAVPAPQPSGGCWQPLAPKFAKASPHLCLPPHVAFSRPGPDFLFLKDASRVRPPPPAMSPFNTLSSEGPYLQSHVLTREAVRADHSGPVSGATGCSLAAGPQLPPLRPGRAFAPRAEGPALGLRVHTWSRDAPTWSCSHRPSTCLFLDFLARTFQSSFLWPLSTSLSLSPARASTGT